MSVGVKAIVVGQSVSKSVFGLGIVAINVLRVSQYRRCGLLGQ